MTVLWIVKATISAEEEEAFNRWYNSEHCPQLLRYRGAVSARRYKKIMGDDKFQFMTLYEFDTEETFREFLESDQREPYKYRDLVVKVAGYNARFADLHKALQDSIIARTEHGL